MEMIGQICRGERWTHSIGNGEGRAHQVENEILAIGVPHETAEDSGEGDGVEHACVGYDPDHRKERILTHSGYPAVGDPDLVCEKEYPRRLCERK